ncbi:MAG: UDP-N-acetylmuramate dehydrogenase [Spirochaetota bacterium]
MPTLLEFLRKINIDASIALEEPLSSHTSLRIGGPAEALVAPRTAQDLVKLLAAARREGIDLFFLGGGANILVGDRGIRGLVIDTRRLDEVMREVGSGAREGLWAAAGISISRLCECALALGLSGLETFYGMPGSLGGSVFMNARCYEVEMADRLRAIDYMDRGGRVASMGVKASDWSYKRSPFQEGQPCEGALVLGASFTLSPGDPHSIAATMREKKADREAKGHYRLPSAGSIFKNDRNLGRPTGKILDELGFRGRRIGDALVSSWHANIFVNAGKATAHDLRALVESAQAETRRVAGIEIEPELLFVGDFD